MENKIVFLMFIFLVNLTGCVANRQTIAGDELTVVTTYMPATDLVLALSAKDQLIGVDSSSSNSELLKNLQPKHEVVGVGSKKTGINIEQILSLNPDVVILYPIDSSDDTLNQLEKTGIDVISINPETMESLMGDILAVGQAIGKEKVANELIAYMNEKVTDVTERVQDINNNKNVYLAGASGILSTSSGTFYQHEIITIAGGNDLAKGLVGGWNVISVEQLIRWNPDVIMNVNYSQDTVSTILNNQALSNVKAIKESQVYEIPADIESWDMPKPSSILAIMWMGKTLYPEKFTDVDLIEEANNFYEKFYGLSFENLGGSF